MLSRTFELNARPREHHRRGISCDLFSPTYFSPRYFSLFLSLFSRRSIFSRWSIFSLFLLSLSLSRRNLSLHIDRENSIVSEVQTLDASTEISKIYWARFPSAVPLRQGTFGNFNVGVNIFAWDVRACRTRQHSPSVCSSTSLLLGRKKEFINISRFRSATPRFSSR